MNTVTLFVETPERMQRLGRAFGRVAIPGDRFLLQGPFGAGKTTLVQGLAQGLDVEAPVSSPSFVIENLYEGRLPLYHVDLYRLERMEPGLYQQLEEHLFGEGVTVVEWAERLPADLCQDATFVRIAVADGGRRVEVGSTQARLIAAATAAT